MSDQRRAPLIRDDTGFSGSGSDTPGTPEHASEDTPSGPVPQNVQNLEGEQSVDEPQNPDTEMHVKDKGLFTWIIDFFKPVTDKMSAECKEVETAFDVVKERCERFDNLYKKRTIWDLTWKEVLEEIDSIKNAIVDGIRRPDRAFLNTLFPIWYTCYTYMRDSLHDLQDLHEYIAPTIAGVTPVYNVIDESMKTSSIRSICWELNVNFAQRMFVYTEEFLGNSLRYLLMERTQARVPMPALQLDDRNERIVPDLPRSS